MTKRYRINDYIRIPQVRLINQEGKQLGVVGREEALAQAKKAELDLVEVVPNARPPVCKILDFRKFILKQREKQRLTKRKSKKVGLKQFRLRPNIDTNDLQRRVSRAKTFLEEGNQVRLTMLFRGREITHREVGEEKIKIFIEGIGDAGRVIKEPELKGKFLTLTIGPK